jgi:RHS repeat-associated protein
MDISYQIPQSHITYFGSCTTYSEALAACQSIAVEHGYTTNYCGISGGNYTQGSAGGGWFWQQYNVTKTPFHFVRLYFGSLLPPKEYDNLGPPKCSEQCFGDPINAGNGNKFEHVDEFIGAGLFPLQLSWDYNSRQEGSYQHPKVMIFGKRRSHYYGRSVVAISSSQGSVAFVARPDGNAIRFENAGTGWVGPNNRMERLIELLDNGVRTGWRLENAEGGYETYNATGLLVTLTSVAGQSQSLIYSSSDLLESVTDPQGRKLLFSYDASSRVSSVTLPNGNNLLFRYTAAGDLGEVEHPDGTIKGYRYNEASYTGAGVPGLLTGVIDESLNRFSSTFYDSSGRATKTKEGNDLAGVNNAIYTNSDGYSFSPTTNILLPSGATRTLQFTVVGGKIVPLSSTTSCTGCASNVVTYVHDGNGDIATTITNGVSKDVSRDGSGRISAVVEASNDNTGKKRTTQTDWHAVFNVPAERRTFDAVNTLVGKSTWTYNTRGQALTASQIDPVSSVTRTTTMTYCEQTDVTAGICPLVGLVRSVNGPRTDITDATSYTYRMADEASCATAPTTCPYRKGDLWKVANALSQVTETLKYDGAGRPLSVKDANGVITDMEYHPRGWLTARKTRGTNATVETDDQITRIEYFPTGLVKKVTQPDGAFTAYTYDAAHRLTDIADNAGNTIHYTLDNAGNRTKEDTKDPLGALKRTLSRVYNQLGQLQTQADASANPTDFTYDANGNTNTVTDALGRVTDNDYDPLNRLSRTLQDVGGIGAETKFAYDALDNLTLVTDPKGLNTVYTYNGLSDLTQLQSPDTGTTTYTYDSAGNRATQTDARGQTSTYSYDALNRLTGVAYATPALNIAYSYDANQPACISTERFSKGRLTKLTDSSGTTQYCYNRFGQLTRKVQTTNGIALTVRYAYTLAGQLKTVTYPGGAEVMYTRDAQGRVTQVNAKPAGSTNQVLVKEIAYAPFGPAISWKYGNNRSLLRPLNQNYQPTAVQDASVGGLSLGFAFDAVGNLTELTPPGNASPLVKFDYDALSRLTQTKDGPTQVAIETYAYDKTGNRQSLTNAGGTTAYTYPATSHRLTNLGALARTYDAAGNTTAIGGTAKEFVFDATGRMSQVKQASVATMNYAYNGKGEQVRKYLGAANTYTLYDEAGHWLGDYNSSGAPIQQAIWLDDLPVGLIANNQLHYLEPDHLGTPRVVIEPARNVQVWKWDLKGEAFGNSPPDQDPDGDAVPLVLDMRFPGQRYDQATGLNYNYFRDYDPSTGRYTQSDPIGQKGGAMTYGYSGSSPVEKIDPKGLLFFGPSCDSNQRAFIISQIISLAEEVKQKANQSVSGCYEGDCDFRLASKVMDFISKHAYFSCNLGYPCASMANPQFIYFYPPYIDSVKSKDLTSPGQCGCFKSSIFHESSHILLPPEVSEDEVRGKTKSCVSCATNVKENGAPL